MFVTFSSDFGDSYVKPPECAKGRKYDRRIDVWYLGVNYLILFSNDKNIVNNDKDFWNVNENLRQISVPTLRFADKMVKYDFTKRPFAKDLLNDEYWKIDLS